MAPFIFTCYGISYKKLIYRFYVHILWIGMLIVHRTKGNESLEHENGTKALLDLNYGFMEFANVYNIQWFRINHASSRKLYIPRALLQIFFNAKLVHL